ncbi:hypothetical protein U9M48_013611 [Paspalum notatum var. saurae]|uniref:DUF4218 domain-containing protein n=1 Tax=Paspalum notatum var. saurae TaxID=547442 RepID=A0AAQ3T0Q4_PASNO
MCVVWPWSWKRRWTSTQSKISIVKILTSAAGSLVPLRRLPFISTQYTNTHQSSSLPHMNTQPATVTRRLEIGSSSSLPHTPPKHVPQGWTRPSPLSGSTAALFTRKLFLLFFLWIPPPESSFHFAHPSSFFLSETNRQDFAHPSSVCWSFGRAVQWPVSAGGKLHSVALSLALLSPRRIFVLFVARSATARLPPPASPPLLACRGQATGAQARRHDLRGRQRAGWRHDERHLLRRICRRHGPRSGRTAIMLINFVYILCFGLNYIELNSKVLYIDELEKLEKRIIMTLCRMEKIFPPGFFTVMVHLVLHLATVAKIGGPVRNKARPEGCIAESVLAKEAMALCSGFLEGFEALHSRLSRNDDDDESFVCSNGYGRTLFPNAGKPLGKPRSYVIRGLAKIQAHRYVLFNSCDVNPYLRAHAEEIATEHNRHKINHREVEKFQNDKFHEWFRVHMLQLERENSIRGVNNDKIRWLACGPVEAAKRYRAFNSRGFRFRPKRLDGVTQNSGVVLTAKTSSYASASDARPVLGDVTYYGRIIDIIELNYSGNFTVVLFKCEWVDVLSRRGIKGESMDKLNPGWSVVMKMKPRDIYDADCDEWEGDSETEPFHVTHLREMFSNANINNQWVRTDIEGTTVDASTNGFDNQS